MATPRQIEAGLDDDRIEERGDILWNVDAQECEVCGRSALDCGAPFDPQWKIETILCGRDDVGEPVRYAQIRCPECW